MPPNLSASPSPVLLTDQFGLTVSNWTAHFHNNTASALNTHKNDDLIGAVSVSLFVLFWLLLHLYCTVTQNRPEWRFSILWRQYIRPKLPSERLSITSGRTTGQSDFSPVLARNYGDDIMRDIEIGQYGSQDTTLDGSSNGMTGAIAAVKAQPGLGISSQDYAHPSNTKSENHGLSHEDHQVWAPLQTLGRSRSIA